MAGPGARTTAAPPIPISPLKAPPPTHPPPPPPPRHFLRDPFGNYVVQYVLELGHPETSTLVMANLKGHYGELATQKFRWAGRH